MAEQPEPEKPQLAQAGPPQGLEAQVDAHAERGFQSTPEAEDNSFSLHNAFKGSGDTLIREGKALGGTVKGMLDPRTYYHALTDPATEEEKQVMGSKELK